jgi:hypothetical protein
MFKFNPNSVSITSNFPDAEWQCSSAASAIALTDSRGSSPQSFRAQFYEFSTSSIQEVTIL